MAVNILVQNLTVHYTSSKDNFLRRNSQRDIDAELSQIVSNDFPYFFVIFDLMKLYKIYSSSFGNGFVGCHTF